VKGTYLLTYLLTSWCRKNWGLSKYLSLLRWEVLTYVLTSWCGKNWGLSKYLSPLRWEVLSTYLLHGAGRIEGHPSTCQFWGGRYSVLNYYMVRDILWKADSHSACQTVAWFLYGTRRFITVFTEARHWTLSWASRIQFASSIPISLRSILRYSMQCGKSLCSIVIQVFMCPSENR
jgi:hypothetical protein